MDAGSSLTLLDLVYDGIRREIEPYSLAFKRRKDGTRQEYFYGYDRTWRLTGTAGIKCFVHSKISEIKIQKFHSSRVGV